MLALLFPGQGSHQVGMGRDAWEASDAARSTFEAADATLGFPLSRTCFEGPAMPVHLVGNLRALFHQH